MAAPANPVAVPPPLQSGPYRQPESGRREARIATRVGIGVDFGTSNSTAAWFDGERLHEVLLESDGPVVPTAIHLDRQLASLTGRAAIRQYVEENRARRVELVPEIIGEAASAIGAIGPEINSELETQRRVMYGPLVDRGLPGRLFLGLKRLLGDSQLHRLSVFDRPFRLVALITPILLHIRHAIERERGSSAAPLHVGRPVNFEGRDSSANTTALRRLGEALGHAGLSPATFYPEPVAATLSYLWRAKPPTGGIALTVDFGGGTLDLSLIRHDAGRFDVMATAGISLGGDKIDQLLFEKLLFPELGKGERWARTVDGNLVETLFPFEEYESALLHWQITHTLNQNRTKSMVVDRIAKGGPAAIKFERLHDLISYNYSYNCFEAIRRAKVELTEKEHTEIDIPELNLRIALSRETFQHLLGPMIAQIESLIGRLLLDAGTPAEQVSVVIGTGGSSQIVAVRAMLQRLFPGRVVEHDPFTSVAGGLAIASYYGYET